jgi:hypothetical protein
MLSENTLVIRLAIYLLIFCGGICERALENFWQKCARIYEPLECCLPRVSQLAEAASKPQCTAKVFSTRTKPAAKGYLS